MYYFVSPFTITATFLPCAPSQLPSIVPRVEGVATACIPVAVSSKGYSPSGKALPWMPDAARVCTSRLLLSRISKTGGFCSYSTNLIFERSRGLASGLSSG